jgi:hypothetical protein
MVEFALVFIALLLVGLQAAERLVDAHDWVVDRLADRRRRRSLTRARSDAPRCVPPSHVRLISSSERTPHGI